MKIIAILFIAAMSLTLFVVLMPILNDSPYGLPILATLATTAALYLFVQWLGKGRSREE